LKWFDVLKVFGVWRNKCPAHGATVGGQITSFGGFSRIIQFHSLENGVPSRNQNYIFGGRFPSVLMRELDLKFLVRFQRRTIDGDLLNSNPGSLIQPNRLLCNVDALTGASGSGLQLAYGTGDARVYLTSTRCEFICRNYLASIEAQQPFGLLRTAANLRERIRHNARLFLEDPTGHSSNQNCSQSGFNEKAIFKRYIVKVFLLLGATVFCYILGVQGLFLLSSGRTVGATFRGLLMLALAMFFFIHALRFVMQPLEEPCTPRAELLAELRT